MENSHNKALAAIGLKIMLYRKQQGLTQLQLAEMTSYSRNHIQQVETARTVPSVIALLDIARALRVPVAKLFEDL